MARVCACNLNNAIFVTVRRSDFKGRNSVLFRKNVYVMLQVTFCTPGSVAIHISESRIEGEFEFE